MGGAKSDLPDTSRWGRTLAGFERGVVLALMALLMIVVGIATFELGWLLLRDLTTTRVVLLDSEEMFGLFGFFLLVVIGLELITTLKVHISKGVVHVEAVLEVALIAIAQKIIAGPRLPVDPPRARRGQGLGPGGWPAGDGHRGQIFLASEPGGAAQRGAAGLALLQEGAAPRLHVVAPQPRHAQIVRAAGPALRTRHRLLAGGLAEGLVAHEAGVAEERPEDALGLARLALAAAAFARAARGGRHQRRREHPPDQGGAGRHRRRYLTLP
jgi:Phosphate-starvation-inducible E family